MIFQLSVLTFLFSPLAFSSLTLEQGSYANRTHVDTVLRTANLNFTYNGCDPYPSPERVRLVIDGDCRSAAQSSIAQNLGQTPMEARVGEVIAQYDENANTNCANRITRRLHTNLSLIGIYEDFLKKGCFPSHLVIKDGTSPDNRRIWKAESNKSLCRLPETRITKSGFPTEDHNFFNLTANDNGFKVGDHTQYRFDHNAKQWCVKYQENPEKCGQWPSPLPLAYEDSGDKRIHLKATVSLSPDGTASLRAINKTYKTQAELFNDQKNGLLTQTDKAKGRIDYHTWRKPNGLIRAIARSYETDEPHANHQRSLNFFARNVFGVGVTNSWCSEEHCFLGVDDENLRPSLCGTSPKIEMSRGGNGNTCHSCVGITPGHCAIEEPEVAIVREKLLQDEQFTIQNTGEYKLGQDIERGLAKNYERVVTNPKNPGCHQGYAPSFYDVFDTGRATGVETRSINQQNQAL